MEYRPCLVLAVLIVVCWYCALQWLCCLSGCSGWRTSGLNEDGGKVIPYLEAPHDRNAVLSACQPVSLSACQPVSLSACQLVSLSACQLVSLSACQPVSLSACQPVSLSTCQPVRLSACQTVQLSVRRLVDHAARQCPSSIYMFNPYFRISSVHHVYVKERNICY